MWLQISYILSSGPQFRSEAEQLGVLDVAAMHLTLELVERLVFFQCVLDFIFVLLVLLSRDLYVEATRALEEHVDKLVVHLLRCDRLEVLYQLFGGIERQIVDADVVPVRVGFLNEVHVHLLGALDERLLDRLNFIVGETFSKF